MPESYSITADFENIESPELIASSLHVLQNEGWNFQNFNDSSISASKTAIGQHTANLSLIVSNNEVTIICKSELESKAIQFIVEEFAKSLNTFIVSPNFDKKVVELKHHYFMNNPMQETEAIQSESNSSMFATMFSFRKSFRVTPAIIIINVLVFIIMVFGGVSFMSPTTANVLEWGGNFRSFVLQGEWWRLITCCFIHIGIIHIFFNMWVLHDIGSFLERMIGSWRFGFAYLVAGLAGSLNSIVWHYATPSAGASGAIFGMVGLLLALLTTNLLEKEFRNAMLKSVLFMVVFNLLIGTSAMIDNAGHIGGLIAGLICGYLLVWHYKNPKNKLINVLTFLLPSLLIIGSSIVIAKRLPDPYLAYNQTIIRAGKFEDSAIAYESRDSSKRNLDSATIFWDQAIAELKNIEKLELGKELIYHNEQILIYLQKRKVQSVLLKDPLKNIELLKRNKQSIDSIDKVLKEKK